MKKLILFMAFLTTVCMATAAFATNGMNLEGYGPIATGMGGASMAYDNGAAAVMNNPATLGMMPEGDRLDVALGYLGPHIKSSMPGMPEAESSANAFFMPAIGWVRKAGDVAYGLGMFSQGGMGTQYEATSFLALGSGNVVGSELGVGRVIIPLVYSVTPDFTVGGSLDYVWASLDFQMAATGAQLGSLVTGCSGGGCAGLGGLVGAPWARIDFSDGGAFNGGAQGTGYAGKLGATYRIGSFSMGAVYQSKTSLSDLETRDTGAVMSAAGAGVVGTGKISVKDFEWPETYGAGVAWNVTSRLMIAADYKHINWQEVMKSFRMTYEGNLMGAVTSLALQMPQNWERQNVYQIGLAYRITDNLTGRIGTNRANNPIPDMYLNPLFPATVKYHYTVGAGYLFSKASSMDLSFVYAPAVSVINGQGIEVEHSQTNAQIMYSYRF